MVELQPLGRETSLRPTMGSRADAIDVAAAVAERLQVRAKWERVRNLASTTRVGLMSARPWSPAQVPANNRSAGE